MEIMRLNWKMSIRTNPMKAVAVLLKRVRNARTIFLERARDEPFGESFGGKLEKLTRELNKIKEVFMRVKKNEDELLDILTEVDGHLRKLEKKKLDEKMDGICKRIRDCAHKLLPMDAFDPSEKDQKSIEIVQSHDSSSSQHNNQLLLAQDTNPMLKKYPRPEFNLQRCLLSLLVFPEDGVIKKRHSIYWWIGQGLLGYTTEKPAEEIGEEVFDELLKSNLIVPYGNGKCPLVNKFQINPHFRSHLNSLVLREHAHHLGFYLEINHGPTSLVIEQQKVTLGHLKYNRGIDSVFNVGVSYLNFRSQWLSKMKNIQALQLGRWQDSPSHHIEVVSHEFLKELKNLKGLTYLSLRGISRIPELPPSIAQHERLEILDLKACHNLETLPNDISSMKSLTHLILSQCYLLEGMPKGIEKLTQLQVLKGFLIGNSRNTSCRILDLANMKSLRRLSIHIGNGAVIKDREFDSLGELPALEHLKISWGVSDTRYSEIQIILPSSLKKLHLEGFRGQKIPEWLKPSSKLPGGFKELNITGGKLESMNHEKDRNQWSMEIVRLKYLEHLKVDLTNLQRLFPSLRKMSIRTNRMKAVPVLMRRVRSARIVFLKRKMDESFDEKLKQLMWELNKITELFMEVRKDEDKLLDDHKSSEEVHSHDPSSSQHKNNELQAQDLNLLWESYRKLGSKAKQCLPSLSVFPQDAVIKRRQTIYWWIGQGLVTNTTKKTAEEMGEAVIHQLLKFNVIAPHGNGKCPVVNKFKINPHFRHELESSLSRENQQQLGFYLRILFYPTWLVLQQKKVILGDGDRLKHDDLIHTVFNVGASNLDFGSQWLSKLKNLVLLQLGRWQDSQKHHIEVGSEIFLNEAIEVSQSSWDIRISKLPPSIAKLQRLQVLDLKACHNLETLPRDIVSMTSLTHLILSQCYFLEGMPKEIEKLTHLQVLKGFVLDSTNKIPLRISDLANLKHLRRLSIHIGSEAVIKDREFESLGELSALEHLKISWGVSDIMYSDIQIILPSSLKKLHLECFPRQKIPEWLKPSKSPQGLKQLKITGGKITISTTKLFPT
ncbi:Disease resistance RPP13-like protein 4, partial [Mucuna pruriens]